MNNQSIYLQALKQDNIDLYKIVKHDTNIKGYWIDTQGKVFVDNIEVYRCIGYGAIFNAKKELFNQGEQAIFYIEGNKAYIEDKQGNIQVLKDKHTLNIKELKQDSIELLCRHFGGCTVFKNKDCYTLISWIK